MIDNSEIIMNKKNRILISLNEIIQAIRNRNSQISKSQGIRDDNYIYGKIAKIILNILEDDVMEIPNFLTTSQENDILTENEKNGLIEILQVSKKEIQNINTLNYLSLEKSVMNLVEKLRRYANEK